MRVYDPNGGVAGPESGRRFRKGRVTSVVGAVLGRAMAEVLLGGCSEKEAHWEYKVVPALATDAPDRTGDEAAKFSVGKPVGGMISIGWRRRDRELVSSYLEMEIRPSRISGWVNT